MLCQVHYPDTWGRTCSRTYEQVAEFFSSPAHPSACKHRERQDPGSLTVGAWQSVGEVLPGCSVVRPPGQIVQRRVLSPVLKKPSGQGRASPGPQP